jgi:hypothetical protein
MGLIFAPTRELEPGDLDPRVCAQQEAQSERKASGVRALLDFGEALDAVLFESRGTVALCFGEFKERCVWVLVSFGFEGWWRPRKIRPPVTHSPESFFAVRVSAFHSSLRTTPAMEAGVTERVWELAELIAA